MRLCKQIHLVHHHQHRRHLGQMPSNSFLNRSSMWFLESDIRRYLMQACTIFGCIYTYEYMQYIWISEYTEIDAKRY